MPNWVYNTLKVIKGDPQEVFAFVRTEESVFDFNTLVPQPEGLYQGALGPKDFEKYGAKNWYDWNRAKWGTKWNARDARYSTRDPKHVICFMTAWDAPAPVFAAMAKRSPATRSWSTRLRATTTITRRSRSRTACSPARTNLAGALTRMKRQSHARNSTPSESRKHDAAGGDHVRLGRRPTGGVVRLPSRGKILARAAVRAVPRHEGWMQANKELATRMMAQSKDTE